MSSPAIPFSLALILLLLPLSSSLLESSAGGTSEGVDKLSREFFKMEGDVAWIVQVSDLHLSAFHPERAEDLARLLGVALQVIRPDLLLVTGDITDAKNRKRTSTRQDESEWIQYRDSVETLVKESGLERRRIFDIRGNHDKYGVPYVRSDLDFFSIHSVSSRFNRLGTIQSISLVGDDRRYLFLGIDDTMSTGFRGPSNLFGHPTAESIHAVEEELQYWDNNPDVFISKIVFGHFPMSFTASAANGNRYEPIFARHAISAYICGHLHAKFGKQLWKLHTFKLPGLFSEQKTVRQFWEWELGDWKEFRLIRILAIDRGDVSFLNIELVSAFQTTILITYPLDSRSMNRIGEHNNQPVRNDINVLVFSIQPILNLTAKVFDSYNDFKIVEEISLNSATNSLNSKPLYRGRWNADNYKSASATRYWLQVFAIDSNGKQTASLLRPFSVEGKRAKFVPSWLTFLFLYLQWEQVYYILLWSNISFLILLLCLPKLLNLFMERVSSYQNWAMSVSIASSIHRRKFLFKFLWFLIEGSRIKMLWYAMVIYLTYLLTMPWFQGYATSEKGNLFKLCLSGWTIQPSNTAPGTGKLGVPDLMTITLPFMYFVVTPLFLIVYCFSAERASFCFHSSKNSKLCTGWLRKLLLLATAAIACIHLKLVSGIMEAYGTAPLAFSPAFTWVPSLLSIATIYSTRRSGTKAKSCCNGESHHQVETLTNSSLLFGD